MCRLNPIEGTIRERATEILGTISEPPHAGPQGESQGRVE